MKPRRSNLLDHAYFLLWAVIVSVLGADARGQQQPGPLFLPGPRIIVGGVRAFPQQFAAVTNPSTTSDELAENVFLPPERRTLLKLSQAKELMAKGRYGEAVQNLGAILEGPEDYFFQPQANQPIHRSLKAEAQRLIGQMPSEGRELYELQYGVRARQLLREAAAAGDVQGLAEVSRRFFHTRAGYEATFLLGLDHLDHGRPLAAALTLQRLKDAAEASDRFEPALSLAMATGWLQAGELDKARQTISAFRKDHPQMPMKAAAAQIPPSAGSDEILQWLTKQAGAQHTLEAARADRWLMFRGNPQRNAAACGSTPLLNLCWRVPASDDPVIAEVMDQARRCNLEQNIPVLSGLHPLAVDDVVLLRTYKNLLAVDFVTGKRVWDVPVDDSVENLISGGDSDSGLQSSVMAALLSQRAWNDATFGTLSSDGRLVFAIEDQGPVLGIKPMIVGNRRILNFNNPVGLRDSNRLAAYDIRTGKLKWQAGGDAQEYGVRLPDAFFLGPPLPLMGQLYVLAEIKGEIRLLALDAASGNLVWSQQLAVVEQDIQQDSLRRLTGISPSYADGILVCPTSAGALVAVDLATRSLLWGYRYRRDSQGDRYAVGYRVGSMSNNPAVDASICAAEGRVLVTPVDSDSLHCLNLIDGELRWKYKRQDDIYVACVDQGKVILAGRRQVRALSLADGKPAWDGRVVALPEGAMPSGRGFLSGGCYFLPLDSAEVATIDLAHGKVTHVAKSRKGFVPGNLVCYKGRVISQGYDGVDVFYQLDSARDEVAHALADNPGDADALCLQGEIYLDEGKRTDAVECFRRAYAANPEPLSRELLRDALMEGLEQEFADYRTKTAEIEQLLDDPSQQASYYRLMAAGLQRSGDLAGAFAYYLKLIDLDADRLPLERVGKSLSVRRDRWVQAQLALLRLEVRGETAQRIDGEIRARYEAALASGSIEALRHFLDYFGNQPVAAEARAELVRRLIEARRYLEAEMAVWASYPSTNPAASPRALAQVAEMLRRSGRTEAAAATYDWLRREFANGPSSDGKTAAQLVEELPAGDAVREILERKDRWPIGQVEAVPNNARNNVLNYYGNFYWQFKGIAGPYFDNVSLSFDQSRRVLSCVDSLGNNLWQIPLNEEHLLRMQAYGYNRGAHVRALGHLLLVSAWGNLFAVDTLRAGENGSPKILWSQSVGDVFGDLGGMHSALLQGAFGGMLQVRMMQLYNQNNEAEFATARYVCVQRLRSLMALDPLSGATLWMRQDMPQGSTIFGDDEYVFVLPPDRLEAMVLRAADGELLGTRKIPRNETRIGDLNGQISNIYVSLSESCPMMLGRNLLFWRFEGGRRVLELFDPWTEKSVWPRREFSSSAHQCIVGGEMIGILEPGGEFVLLGLADGRVIVQAKLGADPDLADLTVIPWEGHYLVLTHQAYMRPNAPQLRMSQPLMGAPSKAVLRGRLYSIDGSGKLLWPEAVEIKDQQLLTSQPPGLPIVLFACQKYDQKENAPVRPQLAIQAVDKRTGRTVYSGDFSNQPGVLNILGNVEKKSVDLLMPRRTVTLTFTDKPLPPAGKESEEKKPEKPRTSTPKALFKSLERTMDNLFGIPPSDEYDEE